MSYEITTELPRLLDDECEDVIVCTITYDVRRDSDYYEIGETGAWHSYSYIEVLNTKYTLNGKEYEPTDYELKSWDTADELAKENYEECVA